MVAAAHLVVKYVVVVVSSGGCFAICHLLFAICYSRLFATHDYLILTTNYVPRRNGRGRAARAPVMSSGKKHAVCSEK